MDIKLLFADIKGAYTPPEPWEGLVQTVYSKAVNLLHPSGYLISIVDTIENMTDFGLVVSDFGLLVSNIFNGSHFLWKGSQIIFSDIIIDISRASEWSGALNADPLITIPDIEYLKKTFIKFSTEDGLSSVLTKKADNFYSNAAVKLLEKAVKKGYNSNDRLIDLSFLVGLGIGFTPSGDDFLTGIMLYETMSGTNIINRETIEAALSGTTEGGRTLLTLALKNSFPFYLKQFAESITSGSSFFESVVIRALEHGSSSGSDSLTGFLWASEKKRKKLLN